jgi:hypothetical protein
MTAVKDLEGGAQESAKESSSEALEATELAWGTLGYPTNERRRDLREAVYSALCGGSRRLSGGGARGANAVGFGLFGRRPHHVSIIHYRDRC